MATNLLRRFFFHLQLFASIAISLMGVSQLAMAQQGPPPGGGAPVAHNPIIESRTQQVREARLRSAEMVSLPTNDPRQLEAIVGQIKQDFSKIQIARNEMVRALKADAPLDYHFVADKSGDIHKRAARLKTYLLPHVPEDTERNTGHDFSAKDDLKMALVKLCNLISSFTDNPVLKTPGVVDVEQSKKAGSDLMSIVELSSAIKGNAEKKKSAQ